MIAHCEIIRATSLQPGLDLIIVRLPQKTIRSRAIMVEQQPHGCIQVAFESGDVLTFVSRSVVGRIPRTARQLANQARERKK